MTRSRIVGAGATLMLALGILVASASMAGAATRGPTRGPVARMASPTGDCDNDGDNPLGVEFEECSPAPTEPGKLYTPAEKAQADERLGDWLKVKAEVCGANLSDPLFYASLLFAPTQVFCTELNYWVGHLSALVDDPPVPSVFMVAMPAVQLATGPRHHCPLRPAACRRGQAVASAYLYAFNQESAAAGALVITLDRLSATPSAPESQFGSGPGSAPLYSRRTQAATARLYSGLVAAWSDRLRAAEAKFVTFLDGVGGKAKRAARRLPPVLPSAPLWRTYHNMNVFELGQLFSDLITQNFPGTQPTGQLALELEAALQTIDQDLYNLYVASRAHGKIRTRKLDAAAKTFRHDASKFASIPGLAAYAPDAPLSARLFGFAVEGLTNQKAAPVAAP